MIYLFLTSHFRCHFVFVSLFPFFLLPFTAEYIMIHKQRPSDPFPVLCVCLALVHIASQKYISSRNSVFVQLCAFIDKYLNLRGECQESLYNAGRIFHQLNLLHHAVHFYKKALQYAPLTGGATSESRVIIASL